jgi:hypothetical protein
MNTNDFCESIHPRRSLLSDPIEVAREQCLYLTNKRENGDSTRGIDGAQQKINKR